MGTQLYLYGHLLSIILMVAVVYGALAAPDPALRRNTMMAAGPLALVALITGFGLLGRGGFGFPAWAMVKVICWLGLAMLPGLAFRRPGQIGMLRLLTIGAAVIAVGMVVFKPF